MRRVLALLGASLVVAVSCGSEDKAKSVPIAEAGAAGDGESAAGQGVAGASHGGSVATSAGGPSTAAGDSMGGAATLPSGGAPSLGGAGASTSELAGAGGVIETGPVMCSDYAPAQPATKPTTVRLVNNTASNIYLGSPAQTCQFHFDFQVFQGQSELQPSRETCAASCKELQDDGCDCTSQCVSIVTLVAPGKHYDVGWPGTVFTTVKMPGQCATDASCSGAAQTCLIEEATPAGTLNLRATAYTDKECDAGQCFDCTAGVSGSCIVYGAVRTKGTALQASADWTGEGVLQLSFGP